MEDVTPRQEQFIASYLDLGSVAKACKALGIHVNTGHNWLKLASVQDRIKELRASLLHGNMNRLISVSSMAIDTLEAILNNNKASHYAKVRAAETILTKAAEYYGMYELEVKLNDLEIAQEEDNNPWPGLKKHA